MGSGITTRGIGISSVLWNQRSKFATFLGSGIRILNVFGIRDQHFRAEIRDQLWKNIPRYDPEASRVKQANVADWINHQGGSLWCGPANLYIGPNLSQLRQTSPKSCLTWLVWFLFPFLKDFVCTLFHIILQCSTLPFWHLSSSHGNQTVVNQSNHHCIIKQYYVGWMFLW